MNGGREGGGSCAKGVEGRLGGHGCRRGEREGGRELRKGRVVGVDEGESRAAEGRRGGKPVFCCLELVLARGALLHHA